MKPAGQSRSLISSSRLAIPINPLAIVTILQLFCDRHLSTSHHDGGPIQLGWGLRSHMTERTGSDHFLAVTGLVSVPIPETVTDTESPSTIGPTPAGVPVRMTSPGRRVITAEIHSMIFGMS